MGKVTICNTVAKKARDIDKKKHEEQQLIKQSDHALFLFSLLVVLQSMATFIDTVRGLKVD